MTPGGWPCFRAVLCAAICFGALLGPQPLQAKSLIALEPCRIADAAGLTSTEARCGKFSVPEDPDDAKGPQIELAIAVIPAVATKAKPDPLFLIAGGPGQGSIEGYAPILGAFSEIHRGRDLVLVDQRGTGGSNRLDCDMPEDSLEGGEIVPAQLRVLASACLAALHSRPQFYTTSVAVRDLDAVRAALGYAQINVFGGSYGTRVAQHYARRYPERTRTVILEQPCATFESCLAVRHLTSLPMVLDEVIVDLDDLVRGIAAEAMDQVNLKIGRVGGLTRARLMRDVAVELGLRLTIEDTWGGDIVTAAVAQLAAGVPGDALCAVSFMNDWTNEHVAGHEPRSAGETGPVPEGPGLGIEVDVDALGAPIATFTGAA